VPVHRRVWLCIALLAAGGHRHRDTQCGGPDAEELAWMERAERARPSGKPLCETLTRPAVSSTEPKLSNAANPKLGGARVKHRFPAEQAKNTPVPIYFEVPEGVAVARAKLHSRSFGQRKWETVEMDRMGAGFGAMIPCERVDQTGSL